MMCLSYLPAIRDIFPTPMAQYSLFVLKVSLNNNHPTNMRPARHVSVVATGRESDQNYRGAPENSYGRHFSF